MQRENQVTISAGQQTSGHFNNGDFRSKCRIHRSQFQADVSATNYQERAGYVLKIERGSRVQDARTLELQSWNYSRPRSSRDNDAIEPQLLLASTLLDDAKCTGVFESCIAS